MTGAIARTLRQTKPFPSPEAEVLLGILLLASRVAEPWERHLKATTGITTGQYNVLRILRGTHPEPLACSAIAERLIDRDPDMTRLLDRLEKGGLVRRERGLGDRRVVEVRITPKGLRLLSQLDDDAVRGPKVLLGPLGPGRLREFKSLIEAALEGLEQLP